MSVSGDKAWRCTVCGYVHRGPERPGVCPICGSPKEAFEPHMSEPQPTARARVERWRCLNCSYVHSGAMPPDVCPVCGAPSESFEAELKPSEEMTTTTDVGKVVVVGGGVAGVAAAEALRAASSTAEITLLSKEPVQPYYRLNLTRYLAGEIGEAELPIKPQSWYEQSNIQLMPGAEVSNLRLEERVVELGQGQTLPFDRLILTVGAHPFMPPVPGGNRAGVTNLRTISDAKRILSTNLAATRCVCIGGGLLGLETAGALARRGADVTLLEGYGWLLPRQLNQRAGEILAEHIGSSGIALKTNARTREILGDERVRSVQLEDESILPADIVVVATGIRSNSYLARLAGLEVDKGVVVDNRLVTSHPDVFAAGDVAEHRGVLYGTWAPAQFQGNIAGMNAAGAHVEFGGIPRSNALKVLQLDMFSIGQIEPEDASYDVIDQETDGEYLRLVFHDSHLVGAILLGDAKAAPHVKKAVEGKADFSPLLPRRPAARDVIDFISEQSA